MSWVGYVKAVAAEKGYIVRPYDAVLDGRRWFWQRPAPCGRQVAEALPSEVRSALADAVTGRRRKTPIPERLRGQPHAFDVMKRDEIKRRRARQGDLATCPTCEMTVLVDPRGHPGRLTEHRPLPTAPVCRSSGWWRCYDCMDGPDVLECPHCDGFGFLAPVGAGEGMSVGTQQRATP